MRKGFTNPKKLSLGKLFVKSFPKPFQKLYLQGKDSGNSTNITQKTPEFSGVFVFDEGET